jgi:glutamine synthetase
MIDGLEPLTTIVTTDLSAITRGRPVPARALDKAAATGVGWVPANASLTVFGTIADPNPWGSRGDLRILPDLAARYRTALTGAPTPFDMVMGDIVHLDGTPWPVCTRTLLRAALDRLRTATGLEMVASVEQEFLLEGHDWPAAHAFAFDALRRTGPFAPQLYAALADAGIEPEMILPEYGADQFEVTCGPAPGLVAADRAIAIREIVREIAREAGMRACFTPKAAPDAVGNGVHIHMSFRDAAGAPATHDPAGPGGLSKKAAQFCGGILDHLPALIALTAPSVLSSLRLKPHNWSSAYTWLADKDREATLRICPVPTLGGRDPSPAFNIEYRAADATANPYLALAGLALAGLDGILRDRAPPPVASGDPAMMSAETRAALGLVRLPDTLEAALAALRADDAAMGWLPPLLAETLFGIRHAEMEAARGLDATALCAMFKRFY